MVPRRYVRFVGEESRVGNGVDQGSAQSAPEQSSPSAAVPVRVKRYRRKVDGPIKRIVGNRWLTKGAFLALFLIGVVQLMAFVRSLEAMLPGLRSDPERVMRSMEWLNFGNPAMSGLQPPADRPEIVAGILPVGHFTSFIGWLKGGGWDTLLPAGLVIIIAALTVSLLFKRGFCGWVCPVGTTWEIFGAVGRKVFGKNIKLPKWLDLTLRGLRYLITFIFFFWLASVSVQEAVGFRSLPYMFIADIRTIESFASPGFIIAFLVAALLTIVFSGIWCRYLCPLGGLYGAMSVVSPTSICRDDELCIQCGKCDAVCHAFIPVSEEEVITSPECDGCMDCVHVCPVRDAVEMKALRRWRIPAWSWPLLVTAVWFLIVGIAMATGNWKTTIPAETFAVSYASVGESQQFDLATIVEIGKALLGFR